MGGGEERDGRWEAVAGCRGADGKVGRVFTCHVRREREVERRGRSGGRRGERRALVPGQGRGRGSWLVRPSASIAGHVHHPHQGPVLAGLVGGVGGHLARQDDWGPGAELTVPRDDSQWRTRRGSLT